jgi:hypothetical protein
MAGDWIKIEHGLPDKPEVMRLASMLNIDDMQVVGHLVRFWCWCDQNMSRGCPVVTGTKKGLDRVAMRDGFVDAMVSVGWLSVDTDGQISIPNYDHHLSHSAKTRGNEQKKKANQRLLSRACPDVVPMTTGQSGGPEKRREEKIKRIHTYPNLEEVRSYLMELQETRFTAEQFYDYYEMCGWKVGGKPIKNWKAAIRTWRNRSQTNGNPSRSPEEIEAERKAARKAESDRMYPVMGGLK